MWVSFMTHSDPQAFLVIETAGHIKVADNTLDQSRQAHQNSRQHTRPKQSHQDSTPAQTGTRKQQTIHLTNADRHIKTADNTLDQRWQAHQDSRPTQTYQGSRQHTRLDQRRVTSDQQTIPWQASILQGATRTISTRSTHHKSAYSWDISASPLRHA